MGCCQTKQSQQASQPGQKTIQSASNNPEQNKKNKNQPQAQQNKGVNQEEVKQKTNQQGVSKNQKKNKRNKNDSMISNNNNVRGVNPNVNGVGGDTTMLEESKIMSLNQSRIKKKKNSKPLKTTQKIGKGQKYVANDNDFADLNQIQLEESKLQQRLVSQSQRNSQSRHGDSDFYTQQDGEESEEHDSDEGEEEEYFIEGDEEEEEEMEEEMEEEEEEEEQDQEVEQFVEDTDLNEKTQQTKQSHNPTQSSKVGTSHMEESKGPSTNNQISSHLRTAQTNQNQQKGRNGQRRLSTKNFHSQMTEQSNRSKRVKLPPSPIKIVSNNKDYPTPNKNKEGVLIQNGPGKVYKRVEKSSSHLEVQSPHHQRINSQAEVDNENTENSRRKISKKHASKLKNSKTDVTADEQLSNSLKPKNSKIVGQSANPNLNERSQLILISQCDSDSVQLQIPHQDSNKQTYSSQNSQGLSSQKKNSKKQSTQSKQKPQLVEQQIQQPQPSIQVKSTNDPKILINGQDLQQVKDPEIERKRQQFLRNKAQSYNDGRKMKNQLLVPGQHPHNSASGFQVSQFTRNKTMNQDKKSSSDQIIEHSHNYDQESLQRIDEKLEGLSEGMDEEDEYDEEDAEEEEQEEQEVQEKQIPSQKQPSPLRIVIQKPPDKVEIKPIKKSQQPQDSKKVKQGQNMQQNMLQPQTQSRNIKSQEEQKDSNRSAAKNNNDDNLINSANAEDGGSNLDDQDGEGDEEVSVKKYFENDNKDRYFTKEQLEYYEKVYKPRMQKPERTHQIRNFRKSTTIGNGSFGTVYSGFDNEHGIVFAVKTVPLSKYTNNTQEKKIQALQHEIDLLKTLNHKNIVKYLGSQKDEDCINIFLEYVSGGSLERIYKIFPLNENLLSRYTKQILEGLEYLHVNNVIHRDIKAANILLDAQGTCKLADFGSSKKYVGLFSQQFNSFCGTPYWMAPEVIRQSGHNRYADIWSLGCTVLEMVAGKPPWSEKNNISVLLAIADAKEPPKYPKTISPELKSFLDCCFKRDPFQRANVYELLRHQFINGKAVLQKYHFALDKIEEENTPGPTPSEYSKKVGSGRSNNISSEGREVTGQTGTAQSTSGTGKKKPGRFFPNNNKVEEIEEEQDENLNSVVTSKNPSQDTTSIKNSNKKAQNISNYDKNQSVSDASLKGASQNYKQTDKKRTSQSQPALTKQITLNSRKNIVNLEVQRLDQSQESQEDQSRNKMQKQAFNFERDIRNKGRQVSQKSTQDRDLSMDISSSKRKMLDSKKNSHDITISTLLEQRNQIPNLLKKPRGTVVIKNKNSSFTIQTELSKSPETTSLKNGSMSPSQLSALIQNIARSPLGATNNSLADQVANSSGFVIDSRNVVGDQSKVDFNNLSFGNNKSSNSGLGGGILGKILAKKSNQASLNSSQILDPKSFIQANTYLPNLKQIQDKLKANSGGLNLKTTSTVFKLDRSKLNASGIIDRSILQKIIQTPKSVVPPMTPSQKQISLIIQKQNSHSRKVHYQLEQNAAEKLKFNLGRQDSSQNRETVDILDPIQDPKPNIIITGYQKQESFVSQKSQKSSSSKLIEQIQQQQKQQNSRSLSSNLETQQQHNINNKRTTFQNHKPIFSFDNLEDESDQSNQNVVKQDQNAQSQNLPIIINDSDNESQLSKVEQFRIEAQRLIQKKKQSLQPIDTSSPGKEIIEKQIKAQGYQRTSAQNLIRSLHQNNQDGAKNYLNPQLPNVTEECMSGTSNLSYMSMKKKEMRKKLQMDILEDIAKEVNQHSSASPPSKTILQGSRRQSSQNLQHQQLDELSEDDESLDSDEYDSPDHHHHPHNVEYQQDDNEEEKDYLQPNRRGSRRSSQLMIIKQKTQNEVKKREPDSGVAEEDINGRKSQFFKLKTTVDNNSDQEDGGMQGGNDGFNLNREDGVNKSSLGMSDFQDGSLKISQNQPSHIDGGGPQQTQSPNAIQGNVQEDQDEEESQSEEYEYDDEEEEEKEDNNQQNKMDKNSSGDSVSDNDGDKTGKSGGYKKNPAKQGKGQGIDEFRILSGQGSDSSSDSSSDQESARMDTEEMEKILQQQNKK